MNIEKFKPLLASPTPDNLRDLKFPVLVSAKFDGVRALIRGGRVMSRSLKPISNQLIQSALGNGLLDGLDGELICGAPTAKDVFQRSQSMCSKNGSAVVEGSFHVFDCCRDLSEGFVDRYARIKRILGLDVQKMGGITVKIVPQIIVESVEELETVEKEVLENGYEGVMLRAPNGPYKMGRSTTLEGTLLKLKRFAHDEAEVNFAFEQMANTNEATIGELGQTKRSSRIAGKVGKDTLGGFNVTMISGPFEGEDVDVGTGWTDNERAALWADWKKYRASRGGASLETFRKRYGLLRVKYQLLGAKDKPKAPDRRRVEGT